MPGVVWCTKRNFCKQILQKIKKKKLMNNEILPCETNKRSHGPKIKFVHSFNAEHFLDFIIGMCLKKSTETDEHINMKWSYQFIQNSLNQAKYFSNYIRI